MTEVELKLELFDLLETQDQLQLEHNSITKLKDDKIQSLTEARKNEDKEIEKSLKLEVFDLLEKLDLLKLKFTELDKEKSAKYTKLIEVRESKTNKYTNNILNIE